MTTTVGKVLWSILSTYTFSLHVPVLQEHASHNIQFHYIQKKKSKKKSIPFRALNQPIHLVVICKMNTCSSSVHALTHMHVVTLLSVGLRAQVRNTKHIWTMWSRYLTYLIKAAVFFLQGFKIKGKNKQLSVLHFNENKVTNSRKEKNRATLSCYNRKEHAGMNNNFTLKIWN